MFYIYTNLYLYIYTYVLSEIWRKYSGPSNVRIETHTAGRTACIAPKQSCSGDMPHGIHRLTMTSAGRTQVERHATIFALCASKGRM